MRRAIDAHVRKRPAGVVVMHVQPNRRLERAWESSFDARLGN